jgi:uncharacterized protein (DUF1697 family)
MQKYIALFRGINVGGKNILPMKELVSILESMGAVDVKTYIQSGNAVFTSSQVLTQSWCQGFEVAIQKERGFTPKILLLTKKELDRAIANNPFPTEDGKTLHCFFLSAQVEQIFLQQIVQIKASSEKTYLKEQVFYLYTPEGFGRSKLAARAEKLLGVPATARNWNTVLKLAQLSDA